MERIYDSPPAEFDDAGHILDDSRAAKAIEGMPDCDIARALDKYELQYQDWKANYRVIDTAGILGAIVRGFAWCLGTYTRQGASRLPEVQILRAMLADLANAHSKLLTDHKAEAINVDTMRQIHRIHGDQEKLRAFLIRHFNEDVMRADSLNIPLIDLCMEIMLRRKP